MTESEFLHQIELNKGIIYKVSRVYFEDDADREDLFQEIILQTWKSIHSFKANSAFSTWLYRIALNTAIVYFKKEDKRKTIIKGVIPESTSSQEYSDEKEKQLNAFYQAVAQLSKIEKALILQYIDGLSGAEISKNIGLSPVNTRVRLNRTKKKLQDIIKIQGYEFE